VEYRQFSGWLLVGVARGPRPSKIFEQIMFILVKFILVSSPENPETSLLARQIELRLMIFKLREADNPRL
jgi:hypothetical protein